MGGGEATRVEPCSHKRLTSSARLGPTLRSSAGWLTEQQAMELGGPLRRIAVFGAGARMAWEAQDINGRRRQGVGCSSEDQVRTFWAGGQDLLGSGIKGENEVGLQDLWLGALFGARGSRGARGVKALEEPLLPTNHNICKESMNIPIAGREAGAVHVDLRVRPIVLASQALLRFLGAGFPCWPYESARRAPGSFFFFTSSASAA